MLTAHHLLQGRQLLLDPSIAERSTPSSLANAAIAGMLVASDDKYADLYGPLTTERFLAGYASAIGVTGLSFDIVDGKRIVTKVPPESAAHLAGIEVGDLLLGLDEVDFSQSVGGYEIATLLRGPIGSTYQLHIQRGGQRLTRTVTRQAWDYLSHQILNGTIGYLRTEFFFADHTEAAIQAIMAEFAAAKVHAVIWDLRDSGGGSPSVAENAMSYFTEPGTLLYSVVFKDGTQKAFKAQGEAPFAALPLVILVNGETWSAGEIVAAAMAERGNSVLLGTTTAGKGVVQDTVPLDEHHLLHFTIAKWLTPTGVWIHEKGVEPTIIAQDDPATTHDELLAIALTTVDDLLADAPDEKR